MSINFKKKFVPRPGRVNKQGRLPDPSELVCVEIPKVFDQCLIKRCLVFRRGRDTNTSDCELRSNALNDPRKYLGSRDFSVEICSVSMTPIRACPDFKKVAISYMISFCADYIDAEGVNERELFEINRKEVIGKFYCPNRISANSAFFEEDIDEYSANNEEANIRLELVAEALSGDIDQDDEGNSVIDITLGYYLVVKYVLPVTLLIPAYDYYTVREAPCPEVDEEDLCELFERAPVPQFYPDQNLNPLFPDSDSNNDDSECDA